MTAISTIDFPAIDGRTVTQAHADLCATNGHAQHKVDSVITGLCPRCGATQDAAKFSNVMDLEYTVRVTRPIAGAITTGVPMFAQDRSLIGHAADKAKLDAALESLTPMEWKSFGSYRAMAMR